VAFVSKERKSSLISLTNAPVGCVIVLLGAVRVLGDINWKLTLELVIEGGFLANHI